MVERTLYDWDYDLTDKMRERIANETIGFYEKGWINEPELRDILDAAYGHLKDWNNAYNLIKLHADVKRSHAFDLTKAEILELVYEKWISSREAESRLVHIGYTAENAHWLVLDKGVRVEKAPPKPKAPAVHKLTKSELSDLYDAGTIGYGDIVAGLEALNYSASDAEKVAHLWYDLKQGKADKAKAAEEAKENPEPNRLTQTEIKALWKAGALSLADVYSRVLELGYTKADTTLLTELWTGKARADIEAATAAGTYAELGTTRLLTKAEVQSFYEYGLMNDTEAIGRLMDLGYSDNDIALILSTWTPYTLPTAGEEAPVYVAPPQVIDRYSLQTMAQAGTASVDETFNALVRMGYDNDNAKFLTMYWTGAAMNVIAALKPDYESSQVRDAMTWTPKLSAYDIKDLYLHRIMNQAQAESYLGDLNYTVTDADLLIRSWGAPA